MTTIILTIIGILLAAAAALMVIFYGGDAFNSGSIGAQANTYQNAGTNVISAIQLAKADDGAWTTVASLHNASNPDLDYLKNVVALPNGAVGELTDTSGQGTVYQAPIAAAVGTAAGAVDPNVAKVCARINTNLKLATAPTSTNSSSFKMGCFSDTTPTFFANA